MSIALPWVPEMGLSARVKPKRFCQPRSAVFGKGRSHLEWILLHVLMKETGCKEQKELHPHLVVQDCPWDLPVLSIGGQCPPGLRTTVALPTHARWTQGILLPPPNELIKTWLRMKAAWFSGKCSTPNTTNVASDPDSATHTL